MKINGMFWMRGRGAEKLRKLRTFCSFAARHGSAPVKISVKAVLSARRYINPLLTCLPHKSELFRTARDLPLTPSRVEKIRESRVRNKLGLGTVMAIFLHRISSSRASASITCINPSKASVCKPPNNSEAASDNPFV